MPTVKEITGVIETFAPKDLQEDYDNSGLQIGDPDMNVSAALLCLDVTEEVMQEAVKRKCNLVISHHPLLFKGLKRITGATPTERIAMQALENKIAVYSAHTNLDATWEGVSFEIAHQLGLTDISVLQARKDDTRAGLGVTGRIDPVPAMEFLRKIKDTFRVKGLRFSADTPKLVIRKVAICGGSGASFIPDAIEAGADIYISGDMKYHDFTTYGLDILLADIGHYESEVCTKKIFSRIIRESFPEFVTYFSQADRNPIGVL